MQNRKVVLMPAGSAKVGYVFKKAQVDSECTKCPLYAFCGGDLSDKKNYKVIKVRDSTKKCPQTGEDLRAVEISEEPITLILDKKGIMKGITVKYKQISCENKFDKYYYYCHETGLNEGDKITIEDVLIGDLEINGRRYALVKAVLKN